MTGDLEVTAEAKAEIAALARRYLWWDGPSAPHSLPRVIAQIMNVGTYDDIRALEALVHPSTLTRVMAQAEPGWFSARAWDFWRGRLGAALPAQPPVRSFVDAG